MKRQGATSSGADRVEQIGTELGSLFQRQIELTRQEALVGLTPAECEEYENIVQAIRKSYSELAKVQSGT
jgi:hypothetical protein